MSAETQSLDAAVNTLVAEAKRTNDLDAQLITKLADLSNSIGDAADVATQAAAIQNIAAQLKVNNDTMTQALNAIPSQTVPVASGDQVVTE